MPVFVAPRLRSSEPGNASRRATWLELFYDLVYVVVVAALGHELTTHLTLWGVVTVAALFVPVWWSWVGVTLYNDRFDTDDLGHRLTTLLQMLGAAALALGVHGALTGPVFAIAYAFLRVLLVAQYLRVARHVPLARPLCHRYALGFSSAAILWLVALALPTPWRLVLWAIAMAIDIGTPLTARALTARLPLSTSHLPERIGLFMIIVLGEAVTAIVRGIEEIRVFALVAGALGLVIAFALWWIYFDDLDEQVVRKTRVAGQTWFYAHLPVMMGIVGAAGGVERLVLSDPFAPLAPADQWLLCGSVALALASIGVIHLTTESRSGPRHGKRRAAVRFASAIVALAAGAGGGFLPALALGIGLAALGAAQIWVRPVSLPAHAAS